jgi:uncharacterized protein with PQ loop repeat
MKETNNTTPYSEKKTKNLQKLTPIWRAVVEMGFIIFLFYSNLLMGEFTHSNSEHGKSLVFAIKDIFTAANFVVAVIAALIGYIAFEYLRNKL